MGRPNPGFLNMNC